MTALPSASQTLRIDFHHTEGGDPALSNRVFWQYISNAPSVTDCNSFAQQISQLWIQWLAPCAPAAVHLTGVIVTDLTSSTSARGEWLGSAGGTRSGASPPDNVCTLLNFQIARRYRGGKPRIYAPWGTDTDIDPDGQHWLKEFSDFVNTSWTAFSGGMFNMIAGATKLQNQQSVSYYKGVNPPITLPAPPGEVARVKQSSAVRSSTSPELIIGHTCNTVLGSQRRRLRA